MTPGSTLSTSSERFRPGLSIAVSIFLSLPLITEIDWGGGRYGPPAEGMGRTRLSSARVNPRPGGGLSHLRHGGGGQNDPPPSNSKTRKARRPGDTAIDSS